MNSATQLDGYKVNHKEFYRPETTLIYSNLTARGSRIEDVNSTVWFGLQYYIKKFLINDWNKTFFNVDKQEAVQRCKRRMDNYLGPDMVDVSHLEELHDLGYLPVKIKALPEGSIVPLRVPMMTIENTEPRLKSTIHIDNIINAKIECFAIKGNEDSVRYKVADNGYFDIGEHSCLLGWCYYDVVSKDDLQSIDNFVVIY